jgi:transcriptional regulator with XRE-family HTH domain
MSTREARHWTQTDLAKEVGMAQSRISLLEDPSYEKFSLTTLKRLASAFDVALIVRFVPFSELAQWSTNITPGLLAPVRFEDDHLAAPPITEVTATWELALEDEEEMTFLTRQTPAEDATIHPTIQ